MSAFKPRNPHWELRVRESFARQRCSASVHIDFQSGYAMGFLHPVDAAQVFSALFVTFVRERQPVFSVAVSKYYTQDVPATTFKGESP